ncbi:MAG: hypothetical protein V4597_15195 [Pseudomonadota bacterium]
MGPLILAAGLALALQGAAAPYYEGIARDSFAAWSFTSGVIATQGTVKTTSVQTLYDSPTAFNGNPTPVAWSIHQVAFDCQAKTATFLSGANYAKSGGLINAANPSPATPWTDYTTGFQQLAAEVCAMKG